MFDALRDRVVETTRQLLSIASPTRSEAAIADWLEARLKERGATYIKRAGHSLCFAFREPNPDAATLMLVGHTDTVPELESNPVRIQGDRLYGTGASDMKAADAVILEVLEESARVAPNHNLVGVLYAAEEGPYDENEMPLIYDAARTWFDSTDLAICMEPTDNRVELGCLGTSHAEVTFAGQRAHSARPWQGDNAIHRAAPFLARLAAREPTTHSFHGFAFVESMSATMVSYRGARNVIPDRFVVNVNYRFAPGRDEAAARRELDELVAGEASYELVDFCPSGRVCRDNRLVDELIGHQPDAEVCAKQAWTDVGRLSHLGVDAINWGPGAIAQAHQANEWVSIESVESSLKTLSSWVF